MTIIALRADEVEDFIFQNLNVTMGEEGPKTIQNFVTFVTTRTELNDKIFLQSFDKLCIKDTDIRIIKFTPRDMTDKIKAYLRQNLFFDKILNSVAFSICTF